MGAGAMFGLPVAEYPQVVPPTIAINASYPGANPETIASTVASPLEQEMTGLPDLLYQSSQSLPDGGMELTLTFNLGTDLDKILPEVQNRVQRATPRLPEEVRRLGHHRKSHPQPAYGGAPADARTAACRCSISATSVGYGCKMN